MTDSSDVLRIGPTGEKSDTLGWVISMTIRAFDRWPDGVMAANAEVVKRTAGRVRKGIVCRTSRSYASRPEMGPRWCELREPRVRRSLGANTPARLRQSAALRDGRQWPVNLTMRVERTS